MERLKRGLSGEDRRDELIITVRVELISLSEYAGAEDAMKQGHRVLVLQVADVLNRAEIDGTGGESLLQAVCGERVKEYVSGRIIGFSQYWPMRPLTLDSIVKKSKG
jgi:hypothetical protein